jgi:hypothetical protein
MPLKKGHLQGPRLKAFSDTLNALEKQLQRKIEFIEANAVIYQFPARITRLHLRQYNKWLRATRNLKNIEKKHFN